MVSLNEPKGGLGIMPYEEIQTIYKTIKSKFAPEYINIFTNRGVEMATIPKMAYFWSDQFGAGHDNHAYTTSLI